MALPDSSPSIRLVIGYGNTIRQDDGVGYRLAEMLAEQPPTLGFCHLKAIAVHQLTPDLAAAVAEATEVIFVDMIPVETPLDALERLPQVQVQLLIPGQQATLGHISNPHSILQLSDRLFGKAPPGYWLLIPGEWCELGDELSPLARAGLTQALAIVQAPQLALFEG